MTRSGVKVGGIDFNGYGTPGYKAQAFNGTAEKRMREGVKNKDADGYARSHPEAFGWKSPRTSIKSTARKAASAMIAKIPFPLASYIGSVFRDE